MMRVKPSEDVCILTLTSAAKSSGGDKYQATWSSVNDGRDRALYIPQQYSRNAGKPIAELRISISFAEPDPTDGWIEFSMFKAAKGSGDDRYTPSNADSWKGDIYLPKEFRSDKVWICFMSQ